MTTKITQIGKDFRKKIMERKYLPKERLPTEAALMEYYQVSRNTIRQMLKNLELEGLIYSIQGSGYYVRDPKIVDSITLKSLEDVSTTKYTSNTVLDFKKLSASPEISNQLEINLYEPVFFFERLRYKNGLAYMLEKTYMPESLFPNFQKKDAEKSIFKYVEKTLERPISYSLRSYSSMLLDKDQKKLFGLPLNKPKDAMSVHSIGYLENSQIFEVSDIIEVGASHVYIARRN